MRMRDTFETRAEGSRPATSFSASAFHPNQYLELVRRYGRAESIWFMGAEAARVAPVNYSAWNKAWSERDWSTQTRRRTKHGAPYPYAWTRLRRSTRKCATDYAARAHRADTLAKFSANAAINNEADRTRWSPSARNMLLYVEGDTIRYSALGYAVHCTELELGPAIERIYVIARDLRQAHTSKDRLGRNKRPNNGPLELRITNTDSGAWCPALSPARPSADPSRHYVVWLNLFSTDFEHAKDEPPWAYLRAVEVALWAEFGGQGRLRPEWSKAWAVSDRGPWRDKAIVARTIALYQERGGIPGWAESFDILARLDPRGTTRGGMSAAALELLPA